MITIKCKNKVAESLLANELSKYKNIEVTIKPTVPVMEVAVHEDVDYNGVILKIKAKCSDSFSAIFLDKSGTQILEYDGHVPDFMPNKHYGDYVQLTIDIKTGMITDWPKDATTKVKQFIESNKE